MNEREYPGEKVHIPVPSFEETPLTRSEYISALVHFYRGELYRATQWRLRLDNTTNWAILSVMGLVTFSLGEPSHSHVGILAGMLLVLTFLGIEARRFRFFDVWRARVHMLEENFFGPILRRDLRSPVSSWGKLVAEDLLRPRFKITYQQAVRARLRRNYGVLFLLLLGSWVLKLLMHPGVIEGQYSFYRSMRIGPVPPWVALGLVAAVYLYLVIVLVTVPSTGTPEEEYWGKRINEERLASFDV